MKDSYKFLIFIICLFLIGLLTIKKNYGDYKSLKDYHTISGFYSSLSCIIASVILLILYLLGKIPFND
jgi:hypothetical protein